MSLGRDVRLDFPILNVKVNGKPLVYLDSAASSQKPNEVMTAYCRFCESRYANVHRGIHTLGEAATGDYEFARKAVTRFVNAPALEGMIFTRGTTESINLVAHSFGKKFIKSGQSIVLTPMEHHANLIPWQLTAKEVGAELKFIPLLSDGTINLSEASKLIDSNTALVAVTHVSNVLGTINPVAVIIEIAHRAGAKVLIDGAQSVPHMPVDLTALNPDFYAFSAHKMLGPTGIGLLYGRPEILEEMDPFQTGGEMIREVFLDHATWNDLPYKFEAGTPAIAEAIGLTAAVEYLENIGMDNVAEQDHALTEYALNRLLEEEGIDIYGPRANRAGVISFNVSGIHPHDLAALLDREGVAIRAGHHCCQPLMRWLGVQATARASMYVYNTTSDIDALVEAVRTARAILA
ncbi:MAG: cysteine desulfurase [Calditrichaeota bacterium]|nr:cysteine desulfurase [Calditrichota bacterium]MCB9367865.1 cysteine desulfurase [Calditrichota bacterium]